MDSGNSGDDFFADSDGQGEADLPSAVQGFLTEGLKPNDSSTRIVEIPNRRSES